MGEVDPAFIQDTQHRPKLAVIEAEGIPLIDLSSANASNHVSQIADASKNWGFFQVINHGVPSESRRKIEGAARKFFALPLEEKRKVSRDEVNPLGYFDSELTKNVRDWKEVFDFVVSTPTVIPVSPDPDDKELKELTNQWPQYPPELRYKFHQLRHNNYSELLIFFVLIELIYIGRYVKSMLEKWKN
ncbi:hypothetical protein VitviT2T_003454 [Vitis vinifera]|uniref:Non-haem dioxygenase N-terminal domain-containing protein n=1 Tax=Vitis vinifera TaxID=29760 RepID=A0ABY9BLL2_VITVI|nr:hypothetical protein VitviT2T_003454 [Vitis vinifera]